MNKRLREILTRLGSFALAGLLLWLALRNVEFSRVMEDLRSANYWWLLPLTAVTLGAHWLRAWRWTFLLHALPAEDSRKPVDVLGAFGALMMGYMANYVAPRVGELVRSASVSRRYRTDFVPVFGTVITERALDVVTLALAFATLPLVFAGRLGEIEELLWRPLADRIPEVSPLLVGLGSLVLVVGGVLAISWLRRARDGRLAGMLSALRDGLMTVARTPRRAELLTSTVLMWLGYGLMAFIPFVMFGFHETFGVDLVDAWGLMLLGAIGVLVPAPGGIGSYHYITIQSLVVLYAFPSDAAASYAILTHTGQLLIYVVTGAVFVFGMGFHVAGPGDTHGR
ncbi:MAG: flippase-like domain-containing protein [Rhodothermales bacterium]|nr:flippase-like domain-containing protein [Rhodothermales bacterium]MBO6780694.1 flippase-like domain-containing protein [Rhodothermales bacterium]